MNPGEYPQPLARVAPLNFTAVNGYTGLRLRNSSNPSLAPEAVKSTLIIQNVGDQSVTLQLREVLPQYVASGTRTNLGSPVTVGVSGFKSVPFTPTKGVLEILCTSGTTTVRAQMEALINWEIMGLGNLNQDGTTYGGYPPSFDKSADQLPWSSL
jgi:hypothetical protein